jgi:hypothetical protein
MLREIRGIGNDILWCYRDDKKQFWREIIAFALTIISVGALTLAIVMIAGG